MKDLLEELTAAAETANILDERMQAIRKEIHGSGTLDV